MPSNKPGDLQVWWIPQVPMKAFTVPVSSVEEAVKIMEVLANYDAFQFEHCVKPDYSNAGGLRVYDADSDGEGNPGWCDWCSEDGFFDDPEEYLEFRRDKEKANAK